MNRIAQMIKACAALLTFALLISACSAPAAAPQAAAPCPAFNYYNLVDIGMTKAEADAKLGLAAEAATGEYDPEGAYYYMDSEGYGIYVLYEDDKLTSKTVQYKDVAEDLAPLTEKPVTEAQCDGITKGMAHADVVKLLGCEGVECSRTLSVIAGEGKIGTIFRWGNKDGTSLQVVFLDDDPVGNAMFFKH
jgi:hypothetical protein